MNFFQVRSYLESFINHENHLSKIKSSSFSLSSIKKLLNLIDDPQNQLKVIHVAGSKGKGSTCALTASILQSAGYKVGLYTSPHLEDMTERIRILGDFGGRGVFRDSISEEALCAMVDELKSFVEQVEGLSFFEILTAMALKYFLKRKVDFVILETGMGGRLDATNVGVAQVCVITSIGLEHTAILGDTLESIAGEKAAIIKKRNQKVVIAPQFDEAQKVILQRCRVLNVQPVCIGKDIVCEFEKQNLDGQTFSIGGQRGRYESMEMPLLGGYQRINASTSIGVVECLQDLGAVINPGAVKEGLKEVYWPGRFEVVQKKPLVILDSAHTPDSVKGTVETFQELFGKKKVLLIFGISEDKNKQVIGLELDKIVRKVILTRSSHARAGVITEEEVLGVFLGKEIVWTDSVNEAVDLALQESSEKDIILITGSVFVMSEARKLCIN